MGRRGLGEGSVSSKRPDGKYQVRISIRDESGKPKQISAYFDRHADAIRGLDELRKEYESGGNAETIRWDTFVEKYFAYHREHSAVATYRLYQSLYKHISPLALPPSTRLHAIKREHIERVLKLLTRQDLGGGMTYPGISDKQRRLVLLLIRKMLNFAVKNEYLVTNVAAKITVKSEAKLVKKRTAILSLDEAKRLLVEASTFRGGRFYELFLVALYTAMRQGEIFALQFGGFDESRRTIRVNFTLTESHNGKLERTAPKTAASRRTLEIPDSVVSALTALRQARSAGPGDFIFLDTEGKPLRKNNFRRDVFGPLRSLAKISDAFTFHGLRHVANSFMLASDGNVVAAQERLGHTTSRMTLDVYAHVLPGHHRAAVDRIDGLFADGKPILEAQARVELG